MMHCIEIESEEPTTSNEHYLSDYKAKYLARYRAERKMHSGSGANESLRNFMKGTYDHSGNFGNAISHLQQMGFPSDLKKEDFDYTKDSERLRILLVLTIWAIWKTRNKCAINNQEIAPTEASVTLKELISDLIRKSWNATRFMEGSKRIDRQHDLRTLWADEKLVVFDPKTGPNVDFS